jgi:2-polyprenyl-3-methyl-5-hydroxy-6-metoxy-1,4-benzoquinol methylase
MPVVNSLKLLVVIASYGRGSDCYLRRLIDEYRSMPYVTDIVVCSNVEKSLPEGVELVVGMPAHDPWSLPFAHKTVMAKRVSDYDLFIYSEDDTLATHQNIEAFLRVSKVLASDEIAGFLRYERCPDGTIRYCDVNGHYHWDHQSVVRRGDSTFACFTNEHAAFYVLTQQQLRQAILSGAFLVAPHRGKYDLACSAATDPYTQCGFRKLVCISHLQEFLLHHLPDKYVGTRFGTSESLVKMQVQTLLHLPHEQAEAPPLVPVETRLRDAWYSKDYYEAVRPELVNAIPATVQNVLSVGCGSGETERCLANRGAKVTAVCLDPVIAACAQSSSIETVFGDLRKICGQLAGYTFDCLVLSGVLHLWSQPESMFEAFAKFLKPNGYCVLLSPHLRTARIALGRLRGDKVLSVIGRYEQSGTHDTSPAVLKRWLASAGIEALQVKFHIPETRRRISRWMLGCFDRLLADELLVVGRRRPFPPARSVATGDQDLTRGLASQGQ